MSASNLSVDDLRFRRRVGDECDILVLRRDGGHRHAPARHRQPRWRLVLRHTPLRRPARTEAARRPQCGPQRDRLDADRTRSRPLDAAAGASRLRGAPPASLPPDLLPSLRLGSGPPSRFDGGPLLFFVQSSQRLHDGPARVDGHRVLATTRKRSATSPSPASLSKAKRVRRRLASITCRHRDHAGLCPASSILALRVLRAQRVPPPSLAQGRA